MIYSLIILISSLFIVHSFYVTNGAILEECSTGATNYLNKFNSTKMLCLNKGTRQITIILEYFCNNNALYRDWKLQTTSNSNAAWPTKIYTSTNNTHEKFQQFNKPIVTLRNDKIIFDPKNNQYTSYLWADEEFASKCRFKYNIDKDICKTKNNTLGAKFTDFICYHGKRLFALETSQAREIFNQLLINKAKPNSNTATKSPNTGQTNPKPDEKDPNLSALGAKQTTFWAKNKLYILIIGGVIAFILIVVLIVFIVCRRQKPDGSLEQPRMSVESDVEQTDID